MQDFHFVVSECIASDVTLVPVKVTQL